MKEKEIKQYHWSNDETFVDQLDSEYKDFENGKVQAYSFEEVKRNIVIAKKKKLKNK